MQKKYWLILFVLLFMIVLDTKDVFACLRGAGWVPMSAEEYKMAKVPIKFLAFQWYGLFLLCTPFFICYGLKSLIGTDSWKKYLIYLSLAVSLSGIFFTLWYSLVMIDAMVAFATLDICGTPVNLYVNNEGEEYQLSTDEVSAVKVEMWRRLTRFDNKVVCYGEATVCRWLDELEKTTVLSRYDLDEPNDLMDLISVVPTILLLGFIIFFLFEIGRRIFLFWWVGIKEFRQMRKKYILD